MPALAVLMSCSCETPGGGLLTYCSMSRHLLYPQPLPTLPMWAYMMDAAFLAAVQPCLPAPSACGLRWLQQERHAKFSGLGMLTFWRSLGSASVVCHAGSEVIHNVSGTLSECRVAPLLTACISPCSSHSKTRPQCPGPSQMCAAVGTLQPGCKSATAQPEQ